ncbi:UNKNOWN [Stylonychia lemnae]|uniref:Uncharacterized protein n=1 Tax=Stylonychia lemnae TaxID=5949 RepID=A0A078AEB6_STYLE|nr:UNKNOWN [Stylonychia lemnae]|eukprot:CDW80545.1 UNKNOWN [Stylonychia lemnae]
MRVFNDPSLLSGESHHDLIQSLQPNLNHPRSSSSPPQEILISYSKSSDENTNKVTQQLKGEALSPMDQIPSKQKYSPNIQTSANESELTRDTESKENNQTLSNQEEQESITKIQNGLALQSHQDGYQTTSVTANPNDINYDDFMRSSNIGIVQRQLASQQKYSNPVVNQTQISKIQIAFGQTQEGFGANNGVGTAGGIIQQRLELSSQNSLDQIKGRQRVDSIKEDQLSANQDKGAMNSQIHQTRNRPQRENRKKPSYFGFNYCHQCRRTESVDDLIRCKRDDCGLFFCFNCVRKNKMKGNSRIGGHHKDSIEELNDAMLREIKQRCNSQQDKALEFSQHVIFPKTEFQKLKQQDAFICLSCKGLCPCQDCNTNSLFNDVRLLQLGIQEGAQTQIQQQQQEHTQITNKVTQPQLQQQLQPPQSSKVVLQIQNFKSPVSVKTASIQQNQSSAQKNLLNLESSGEGKTIQKPAQIATSFSLFGGLKADEIDSLINQKLQTSNVNNRIIQLQDKQKQRDTENQTLQNNKDSSNPEKSAISKQKNNGSQNSQISTKKKAKQLIVPSKLYGSKVSNSNSQDNQQQHVVVSITASGRASKKLINRQEFIQDFESDDDFIEEKSKSRKEKSRENELERDDDEEDAIEESDFQENEEQDRIQDDERDEEFIPETDRNKEVLNYDKMRKQLLKDQQISDSKDTFDPSNQNVKDLFNKYKEIRPQSSFASANPLINKISTAQSVGFQPINNGGLNIGFQNLNNLKKVTQLQTQLIQNPQQPQIQRTVTPQAPSFTQNLFNQPLDSQQLIRDKLINQQNANQTMIQQIPTIKTPQPMSTPQNQDFRTLQAVINQQNQVQQPQIMQQSMFQYPQNQQLLALDPITMQLIQMPQQLQQTIMMPQQQQNMPSDQMLYFQQQQLQQQQDPMMYNNQMQQLVMNGQQQIQNFMQQLGGQQIILQQASGIDQNNIYGALQQQSMKPIQNHVEDSIRLMQSQGFQQDQAIMQIQSQQNMQYPQMQTQGGYFTQNPPQLMSMQKQGSGQHYNLGPHQMILQQIQQPQIDQQFNAQLQQQQLLQQLQRGGVQFNQNQHQIYYQ